MLYIFDRTQNFRQWYTYSPEKIKKGPKKTALFISDTFHSYKIWIGNIFLNIGGPDVDLEGQADMNVEIII